jgi:uncharacterized integral membrane protein (TIGR00698 family)
MRVFAPSSHSAGWSPDLPAASRIVPGLALCLLVTAAAFGLQDLEVRLFGRAWLETLVLAIVLGAAVRAAWTPSGRWAPGIHFSGKILLEIAVVLLGAGLSAPVVAAAGWPLLAGIAGLVAVSIALSYGLGRLFHLAPRMATLVACGNSICGNSAIAAVAPVIDADGDDVAAAISFTAVLGVAAVLVLPALAGLLHLAPRTYGVFAGLVVYAVPQVLAATAPVSSLSAQVGALVKLVRVLMLGPVVLGLSLIAHRNGGAGDRKRPPLHVLVPWFIIGFLGLAAARSLGVVPHAALAPSSEAASALTIVAMAALGLSVDVPAVARAGIRVAAVATLSLLALAGLAAGLILLLGL